MQNHQHNNRQNAANQHSTRAVRREIGLAIWRARQQVQHNGHASIRVVPMEPERKTWYECSTCGRAGTTTWNDQRYCARCGGLARTHEWVRPDVAAAERRAWHARHGRRHRQAEAERESPSSRMTGLRRWAWSTRYPPWLPTWVT